MANQKTVKMNDNAKKIMDFLNAHKGEAFTFAEINKALGLNLKSTGSITRLMKTEKNPDGIIEHGEEKLVEVVVVKKTKTYMIPSDSTEEPTEEPTEESTKKDA